MKQCKNGLKIGREVDECHTRQVHSVHTWPVLEYRERRIPSIGHAASVTNWNMFKNFFWNKVFRNIVSAVFYSIFFGHISLCRGIRIVAQVVGGPVGFVPIARKIVSSASRKHTTLYACAIYMAIVSSSSWRLLLGKKPACFYGVCFESVFHRLLSCSQNISQKCRCYR